MAVTAALVLVLAGDAPAFAEEGPGPYEDTAPLEYAEIAEELVGTVYVVGDEVFSSDLEPVATLDEYIEIFEEAGVDAVSGDVVSGDVVSAGFGKRGGFAVQRASMVRPKFEAPGCSGHDANRSLQAFKRTAKEELREESQSFDVVIHRGAGDTSPPGTKLATARLVLPLERAGTPSQNGA
ncbi:hypothetical protein [Cryobacterium sp. Y82]|uniref:hypothetical protein n=1 Tax=Cryobacterium sp. Y82 TaxID=2045017 RepID=UPI000CE492C2|nr:hypothetical protein [Cryobacterium sp. Y82]